MLDTCDVLPATGSSATIPLVLIAITLIALGAAVSWRWRAGRALYALAALAAGSGLLAISTNAEAADGDCPPAATAAPAIPTPTDAPAIPIPTGAPAPTDAAPAPTGAPSTTGAPSGADGFCLNTDGGATSIWVFIYGDWGTIQNQNNPVADCAGDSGVPEAIYPNDSSCEAGYDAVPVSEVWALDDPGALAGWYTCLSGAPADITTTTTTTAVPPAPAGLCVVDGDGFYVLFPPGDEPSATSSTFRASNGGCTGEVWQSVTFYRSGDCPGARDPWPVNFVLDPTPPVPDEWFYCLDT